MTGKAENQQCDRKGLQAYSANGTGSAGFPPRRGDVKSPCLSWSKGRRHSAPVQTAGAGRALQSLQAGHSDEGRGSRVAPGARAGGGNPPAGPWARAQLRMRFSSVQGDGI